MEIQAQSQVNLSSTTDNDFLVANAIKRTLDHVDENTDVYFYKLQLPKQFNNDIGKSTDVFAKTQSDFCKHISRHNEGRTPKYVAIRKADVIDHPEYAVALFIEKPTNEINPASLSENGNRIAHGKIDQAGWEPYQNHDLMAIFKENPGIRMQNNVLRLNEVNARKQIIDSIKKTIGKRMEARNGKKSLFVSRLTGNSSSLMG